MPAVQFVGLSRRDSDNPQANSARLVNLYREKVSETEFTLKSVLSMSPAHASFDGMFVRAMGEFWGTLYAVCNGGVYSVDFNGGQTKLFDIDDGKQTTLSSNGSGTLTICANGKYYLWDGSDLTEPTGGAFDEYSSVDFLNHYTLLTKKNGRQFQWSAIADPATLDGYYFTTADGTDDNIVRGMVIGGKYWVFKDSSYEVWYNTGDDGADAFARVTGAVFNTGLAGFHLICQFGDAAFFIGNDGRAHLAAGLTTESVSSAAVETAIAQHDPQNCFTYEDEGHTFCCITFKDAPAWCYDVQTQEWHERAVGVTHEPWDARCSAKFGGRWFVGRGTGIVSLLGRSNTDGDGVPLLREAVSSTMRADGKRFIVSEAEVFPSQGITGKNMWLAVSRDAGMTWSLDKVLPLGGVGNYGRRAIWRNLGQARQFTARLRWSDPADISVMAQARVAIR